MKKEIFTRRTFRRKNYFLETLFDRLEWLGKQARMLLEVFLRRNFGSRYFSLASCIVLALVLLAVPTVVNKVESFLNPEPYYETIFDKKDNSQWTTWYIFIGLFLVFAFWRNSEISHDQSEFDFDKYSLHLGDINKAFFRIKIRGKIVTPRIVEIYLEPGVFLLLGIVLKLADQPLGLLLIVSSVLYSISYAGAYYASAHSLLDHIDDLHKNAAKREHLVDGLKGDRGEETRFRKDRPTGTKRPNKDNHANPNNNRAATVE